MNFVVYKSLLLLTVLKINNIVAFDGPLKGDNLLTSPFKAGVSVHPDAGLNIEQFLEKYNYPLEFHEVITEDGYILTMHRIPRGRSQVDNKNTKEKTKPVIFLVHGISGGSMDYICMGPDKSLALILADLGYDVWLANCRGNVYSMNHKKLTTKDKAFWDYSFHEKGYYDMPASIDYILNYTKQDNITYLAHSQGTAQGLVLTTTRPEYNKKINLMIFMSPIAFVKNIKSPVFLLLAKYLDPIKLLVNLIGIHGLAHSSLITSLVTTICDKDSPVQLLCMTFVGLFNGFDFEQIDTSNLPVFLSNNPGGLSTKELYHFGQELKSGYFRQYDYGVANMFHYNKISPPSYDLKKVSVPYAFYYGKNDYLSANEDVEKLLSELPGKPVDVYLNKYEKMNHLDFLTAKDVKTLVYDRLIGVLQKYVSVSAS